MIDLTQYHIFDGGMGTMLQARGLAAGECPERLNCSDTRTVEAVHAAYLQAGADIITTNTFGASRRKLGEDPAPYIAAGVDAARRAGAPYIALDVGPLGGLMEPYGDMSFAEAYRQFAEIMAAGEARRRGSGAHRDHERPAGSQGGATGRPGADDSAGDGHHDLRRGWAHLPGGGPRRRSRHADQPGGRRGGCQLLSGAGAAPGRGPKDRRRHPSARHRPAQRRDAPDGERGDPVRHRPRRVRPGRRRFSGRRRGYSGGLLRHHAGPHPGPEGAAGGPGRSGPAPP